MKKIFIYFLLLFLISNNLIAQELKVVGISDGDSFTVLNSDNTTFRIRLHGVDCPEYKQPYSQVAKKFTSDLIFKKNIKIKDLGKDRYGRTLAIVYLPDNSILNEKLLSAGLAWHYKYFDKNPYWSELEEAARKQKIGLWSQNNPIEPWNWRIKNKEKQF